MTANRSAGLAIETVPHALLTARDLEGLRALFDAEYLADFGARDPELPYGYAPHDVHIVARVGSEVVGHVGWQRRVIGVGGADVVIAGVGGVLVSSGARGQGVANRLMTRAATSMTDAGDIGFGYLGCREEVVPFYESCGWRSISAGERSLDRRGEPVEQIAGPPILILPLDPARADWPSGSIDLRGRAW